MFGDVALALLTGLAIALASVLSGALSFATLLILAFALAGTYATASRFHRIPEIKWYYVTLLLFPYLPEVAGRPVRFSILALPFIALLLFGRISLSAPLSALSRATIRHPVVLLIVLYLAWQVICSLVNQSALTTATASYFAHWIVIPILVPLLVLRVSQLPFHRITETALELVRWLPLIALISVGIGVLEIVNPEAVRPLYSPRGGDELWGLRGGDRETLLGLAFTRVGSIIGAPNAYGCFLGVSAVLAFWRFRSDNQYSSLMVAGVLLGSIWLLPNSRGAMLASLVAIAFSLVQVKYLLAIVCGGTVALLVNDGLHRVIISQLATFDADAIAPLAERLSFWLQTLDHIRANPTHLVFGFGTSNRFFIETLGVQAAHNVVITNLHWYGVPGVALLLGSALAVARMFRRIAAQFRVFGGLPYAFSVVLIHSLIDDMYLFNTSVMAILVPLLSVFVCLDLILKKTLQDKELAPANRLAPMAEDLRG